MTTADVINRIIEKLHPQSRVTFSKIATDDMGHMRVQFAYGHHRYHVAFLQVTNANHIYVLEMCEDGGMKSTMHSQYVEGVLNGLTPNEEIE